MHAKWNLHSLSLLIITYVFVVVFIIIAEFGGDASIDILTILLAKTKLAMIAADHQLDTTTVMCIRDEFPTLYQSINTQDQATSDHMFDQGLQPYVRHSYVMQRLCPSDLDGANFSLAR